MNSLPTSNDRSSTSGREASADKLYNEDIVHHHPRPNGKPDSLHRFHNPSTADLLVEHSDRYILTENGVPLHIVNDFLCQQKFRRAKEDLCDWGAVCGCDSRPKLKQNIPFRSPDAVKHEAKYILKDMKKGSRSHASEQLRRESDSVPVEDQPNLVPETAAGEESQLWKDYIDLVNRLCQAQHEGLDPGSMAPEDRERMIRLKTREMRDSKAKRKREDDEAEAKFQESEINRKKLKMIDIERRFAEREAEENATKESLPSASNDPDRPVSMRKAMWNAESLAAEDAEDSKFPQTETETASVYRPTRLFKPNKNTRVTKKSSSGKIHSFKPTQNCLLSEQASPQESLDGSVAASKQENSNTEKSKPCTCWDTNREWVETGAMNSFIFIDKDYNRRQADYDLKHGYISAEEAEVQRNIPVLEEHIVGGGPNMAPKPCPATKHLPDPIGASPTIPSLSMGFPDQEDCGVIPDSQASSPTLRGDSPDDSLSPISGVVEAERFVWQDKDGEAADL